MEWVLRWAHVKLGSAHTGSWQIQGIVTGEGLFQPHFAAPKVGLTSPEDYNANEVDKKLSKLLPKPRGEGIGFGTIKHWLKEDNLEVHQQLFNAGDQLDAAISSGGQHLDLAEAFSSLFPREFVWATTTKDTVFYRFTSTVWERQEDDATVFNLLSQEVSRAFGHKATSFRAQLEGEQDLAIKEQLEKKATLANKIACRLRSMPYCRQVYAAITKRLYSANFLEQLDTNLDLLAFKNGVYDLRASSFRNGRLDDMLSKCVPYNFPEQDPERREGLLTFLNQIKPQDDEREIPVGSIESVLVRTHKKAAGAHSGWSGCRKWKEYIVRLDITGIW